MHEITEKDGEHQSRCLCEHDVCRWYCVPSRKVSTELLVLYLECAHLARSIEFAPPYKLEQEAHLEPPGIHV